MPLGATFQGHCSAPECSGPQSLIPEPLTEDRLRDHCNCGYARTQCTRFPKDAQADAIRFHIASQDDVTIQLIWIREKDHAPIEHGTLIFLIREDRWQSPPSTDLLTLQAQAFLTTHHHRAAAGP